MKRILIIAALLATAGCTQTDKSYQVLSNVGYSDIKITGYRIFGCSDDDHFHTGFKALAPSGRPVSGIVCSGWFKGATVRLD